MSVKYPPKTGLAARIDVSAEGLDGIAHRRHDAGVIVGHHREHKTVGKSRHHKDA